jgi:hypothetical protein
MWWWGGGVEDKFHQPFSRHIGCDNLCGIGRCLGRESRDLLSKNCLELGLKMPFLFLRTGIREKNCCQQKILEYCDTLIDLPDEDKRIIDSLRRNRVKYSVILRLLFSADLVCWSPKHFFSVIELYATMNYYSFFIFLTKVLVNCLKFSRL